MNASRKREVIVELETVRLIRKRTKTIVMNCEGCSGHADFVPLGDAATLFEVPPAELFNFASASNCHIQTLDAGEIHICLAAFIAAMKTKNGKIKLLGDQ
jgi:hypothetical protein